MSANRPISGKSAAGSEEAGPSEPATMSHTLEHLLNRLEEKRREAGREEDVYVSHSSNNGLTEVSRTQPINEEIPNIYTHSPYNLALQGPNTII